MKTLTMLLLAICLGVLLVGCATSYPVGAFYTKLNLPVDVTGNAVEAKNLKVGTAECQSILTLVATGDASIDAAMKNGKITKVYYVDWDVENILGIIGRYKTTVYGE